MSLKRKLLILILIPCMVIATYALISIWNSTQKVNQLAGITDLIAFINSFAQVELVLPEEKNHYLDWDPEGPAWGRFTMQERRAKKISRFQDTDDALAAFYEVKAGIDFDRYQPAMSEALEAIQDQLDRLPEIRSILDDERLDNRVGSTSREWETVEAYYTELGNSTRKMMAILANETDAQSIARRVLMIYKASEAMGHALLGKGMVFWAIQVTALPEGANLVVNTHYTREQLSWDELFHFATPEFSRLIQDFLNDEKFTRAETFIKDIIQKGHRGDYVVKTEAEYEDCYEHLWSFSDIIDAMKADLDQAISDEISTAQNSRTANIVALVLSLVLTILISLFLSRRMVLNPLRVLGTSMQEVASGDGDLTRSLEIRSRDEIGEVANHFNVFLGNIHGIVVRMKEVTEQVTQAGGDLLNTSGELAGISARLESETEEVSSSSQSISASSARINDSTEIITESINEISSAVEELSSSINEIARSCNTELEAANESKREMEEASDILRQLNQNASEIQSVVDIINAIAAQTNLLALNATIEAASAGEAGKGFAVVANEVKELARQSSDATEKISKQVASVQSVSKRITETISKVGSTIDVLFQHSESIAAAAEEQSVTTNEIANSFARISTSVNDLAPSISELSDSTQSVSGSLESLSEITQKVLAESEGINRNAERINALEQENQQLLTRFKT